MNNYYLGVFGYLCLSPLSACCSIWWLSDLLRKGSSVIMYLQPWVGV